MSEFKSIKESVSFVSDDLTLVGNFYHPDVPGNYPAVLFLHGGGTRGKVVSEYAQERLAGKGFSSLGFDFRGVGDSEGNFEDGSLNNRLHDAESAYQYLKELNYVDSAKICVSGSSMGAHIAVRLIEKHPEIKAVNLVCAAAYGKDAENKKLNEEFTRIIRQNGSWKDSQVFLILQKYRGGISVEYGEEDDLIPREVQDIYGSLVSKPEYYLRIKNGKHQLNRPQNDLEYQVREELEEHRLYFLQETLQ